MKIQIKQLKQLYYNKYTFTSLISFKTILSILKFCKIRNLMKYYTILVVLADPLYWFSEEK